MIFSKHGKTQNKIKVHSENFAETVPNIEIAPGVWLIKEGISNDISNIHSKF